MVNNDYLCIMVQNGNTICAVSTPAGVGGIAVIRVSGSDAIAVCDNLIASKRRLADMDGYQALFGKAMTSDGSVIDEVIATLFRNPHSFTGEDVVEISCHGSIYIQQLLVQRLLQLGCAMAMPGEFTERAFLNGKMDLSQAEAVADLIASRTASAHRVAMSQMRGGFSGELASLRSQLLDFTSLIELELDFSEEDVEFADRQRLAALAETIREKISSLAASFSMGNAIKNGVPVAIVGETNAGKSTLLNTLLGEEKAIVSDIHGTTRDAIEDTTTLNGVLFRFIDTAGIRQTDDVIENLGIERSYKAIEKASIVLWMVDATAPTPSESMLSDMLARCASHQLIILINKCDTNTSSADTLHKAIQTVAGNAAILHISAKKGDNIDGLRSLLIEASHISDISESDIVVTNLRHYEALCRALDAIINVQAGLDSQLSGDLLALPLHDCLDALGSIIGAVSSDEVLSNIFSKFCIGK